MIKRELEKKVREKIGKGKVIVILGARQVGKTTLLKEVFGEPDTNPKVLWLNGDTSDTLQKLSVMTKDSLGELVKGYQTVIIDEAQRVENIGLKLKILQDNFGEKIQFVATGSSSFDLANKVNEPLTGRKWTMWMYPLSVEEMVRENGRFVEQSKLAERLVFGAYPAVIKAEGANERREVLDELATENLYRDVVNLGEIIKTDYLRKILRALALQVGSQVSMTELAGLVELDRKTVDKYISLLEQAYVIFRLPSFGRNLRNELKFSQKIYFYDNGIRNALIGDYRLLNVRDDGGKLFENYIVSEFKKKFDREIMYFWRTTDGAEIDFVVQTGDTFDAYEVKLNPKKAVRPPKSFMGAYKVNSFTVINPENYVDILAG